jgi:hypothetical protein
MYLTKYPESQGSLCVNDFLIVLVLVIAVDRVRAHICRQQQPDQHKKVALHLGGSSMNQTATASF